MDYSSMLGGASGGGAAAGGMGMLGAGVSMYGNYMNQHKINQMERERKKRERDQHQFNMKELQFQKEDLAHDADNVKASALGNANDRGVFRSSIPQGDIKEIDFQKNNRMAALERRQAFEEGQMGSMEKMWGLQSDLERNKKYMSMINGFMNGGLTGMAGA